MLKTKDSLKQRSDKVTIVLNDNGADLFKSANHIVKSIRCNELLCIIYIACIKHDKDVDEETQHVKTTHYHLIIQFDKTYTLSTILQLIVDTFKCNSNQITIAKCNSLCMQSRYLIHLDELPSVKYHYNADDVVTYDSHNSRDEFNDYLNRLVKVNSVNDIIAIIQEFPRLDKLIAHIGLDNYKKYRVVIQDLRREMVVRY